MVTFALKHWLWRSQSIKHNLIIVSWYCMPITPPPNFSNSISKSLWSCTSKENTYTDDGDLASSTPVCSILSKCSVSRPFWSVVSWCDFFCFIKEMLPQDSYTFKWESEIFPSTRSKHSNLHWLNAVNMSKSEKKSLWMRKKLLKNFKTFVWKNFLLSVSYYRLYEKNFSLFS